MAFLAQKSETELDFRNEKCLDVSSRWEPVVACRPTHGKSFGALSICGSCGFSKESNVLDLSRLIGVSRFWFGVRPTPPGAILAGTDRHWEGSSLNISNYFIKKEFDSINRNLINISLFLQYS